MTPYPHNQLGHLGDWKSTLKKVRDTVHKIFPRELSPTRLMEKYVVDQKKKGAAKLTKVATSMDAANAAADASLAAKLSQLQTALPGPASFSTPETAATPGAPIALSTSSEGIAEYLPYLLGAGGLLLVVLVASRK